MIQLIENKYGIFWVNFKGETTVDSILDFLKIVMEKGDLPENLNALYDFSETVFLMPPEGIKELAFRVSQLTSRFKTIRTALVANDPDKTAYTILFKQESASLNTIREIFSSIDSAIDWLLYR